MTFGAKKEKRLPTVKQKGHQVLQPEYSIAG